jgi:hypothetical protein
VFTEPAGEESPSAWGTGAGAVDEPPLRTFEKSGLAFSFFQ